MGKKWTQHCYHTCDNLKDIISYVSSQYICSGNVGFGDLCRTRSSDAPAVFLTPNKEISAYEETGYGTYGVVRHMKCALLTSKPGMCNVCAVYRSTLNVMQNRIENTTDTKNVLTSHGRNDYLGRDKLVEKLNVVQSDRQFLKRKLVNISERLEQYIQEKGEVVNETMTNLLQETMSQAWPICCENMDPDSAMALLWKQQEKCLKAKSKTGYRWHPGIIKLCLAIHAKSPSTYKLIQGSKFLILPHETTLRHYGGFTEAHSGFSKAVMERIKSDIRFNDLKDYQKNFVLLFDEMRIKSGLVYDHVTGNIIGFTDMGDISNEIEQFVQNLGRDENINEPAMATHVMALMVRGIFIPHHIVFGHSPCRGFKAKYLYPTLQKAIRILEIEGFKVRAVCSDGATPNRKVYRMLARENFHFSINRWSASKRKLYLFCDVPHLMKTTRNNWENSHWNSKTRYLRVS